ncbi:DUF3549 family protein [Halomonas vilamensis]|uniref:DUF3549 family protein n=1 Tax=Vreelandella vilamensis TaxID=531309 RepID=A0ABU1H612_9GAMM|nr:DUF3549 family protein [Halomonas vilamensis]MDR5899738.1 DUF3549 family protein [Halomonas vilamensis]
MQPIHTLDDFFMRSGADVSFYHMGRRVTPCPRDVLSALETGNEPWPEPWQGHARLAIVFRLGDMPEPAIWFLSFPLDEQGYLSPAQRDAFLQRLLETLGRNATKNEAKPNNAKQISDESTREIEHLMKDNPLAFTPSLPFQAMLNARATDDLGLPASQHLEPVEAYISRQQSIDWQALGFQGVADFVVRMDDTQAQQLTGVLETLPTEMLHSICYCLEHTALPTALVTALRDRGEQAATQGDVETLCACVRAVGSSQEPHVGEWYQQLLEDSHACGPDLLAAMAGRGWMHLEDNARLPLYLNRLAEDDQNDFGAVIRDLALIPRLRLPVIMLLRDAPEGSTIQQRLASIT